MSKIGILITNTGTPLAPTKRAVRRYLREFLSDRRIVKLPRLIWLPILYGLVLTIRPKRSAKLYQKIWQPQGSPMRTMMQSLVTSLESKSHDVHSFEIEMGMNYGSPSIPDALQKLQKKQINKLIVLPLFPQYSNTTTASTFDRVIAHLKKWPALPDLSLIRDYADNDTYIQKVATTIKAYWQQHGMAKHLLISFHGIPERFTKSGDPYRAQCETTANQLANELGLSKNTWTLCYQSQFGYDKWLKPSTQALFEELPARGVKQIDVVCPGFSVDCLETLEEIAIRGKETFLNAGGHTLRYIPALNDSEEQLALLWSLINTQI